MSGWVKINCKQRGRKNQLDFFIAGKFHQGAKFTIENLWKTLGQIFGRGKEKLSSEHIQFTFAAISGQLHEEEKITF